MAKQIISQRLIYKIHSSRFRLNNWNLHLTFEEAKENEELVLLGDSILLRMIRDINGNKVSEKNILDIKEKIKKLKRLKSDNLEKIKALYEQLEEMIFIEDYISIVFDNITDWNLFNCKGNPIFFNDNQYVRLIGTNGAIK